MDIPRKLMEMINQPLKLTCRQSQSLLTFSINGPTQVTAHFYPNITSIPTSIIPNASIWDAFNKFAGCQKGIKSQGLAKLKKYFQLFGYINNSYHNFSDDFEDYLEAAVRNYQLNFNLNVTGELDEPTLKHIVQPRCGNPDIVNGTSTMRGDSSNTYPVAHYTFFPNRPRWPPGRNRLTYAFRPANQLSAAVKEAFRRAFDRWTEVTTLTFVETATSYDGADIQIGFYSGDHGDGEPFDGVLGTLAHAFSPPVGRLHMDGEENFRMDTKRRGYEMRNNLCLCEQSLYSTPFR
ncbi:hypothetical protein CASFOL_041974 [Castilleja foliolosa]|uniref:Peptidase metallopeptidase domain-containing protein n=1 Tax=Castilleja foliolosa TaxID=1961234 RepID=A0ABD3BAK8_9LAMI